MLEKYTITLKPKLRTCLTSPKVCIDCKKKKKPTEFYIQKKYRTNIKGERTQSFVLNSCCKECHSERTKRWQIKNRDRYLTYQKDYVKKHTTRRSK